jgi:hypothetical protein
MYGFMSRSLVHPEDFLKTLQESIDLNQIPAYWGGTATGPGGDPTCGVRSLLIEKKCLRI